MQVAGVGDRPSDAEAYLRSGLRPFVVVHAEGEHGSGAAAATARAGRVRDRVRALRGEGGLAAADDAVFVADFPAAALGPFVDEPGEGGA